MIFFEAAPRTSGQTVEPFHAIAIAQMAYRRAEQGLPVFHMEFGQPTCGAPKAAIAMAHAVLDQDPMGYWESPMLKQRLARHYQETYGVTIAPERIPITMGASAALAVAFVLLFRPGDSVAMAKPGYSPYRNALRALNLVPYEIRCDATTRYQITPEHIEALPSHVKGLIIASPANPTGTMISGADLQRITALCRRRGIILISDEVYHGLTYNGTQHSALECSDDAIVVSSFSKYYGMAGWRLGWMVVPESLAKTFNIYANNLFLSPPSLAQHAACVALDAREELDQHRACYAANRAYVQKALLELGIDRIAPPDGAFYIYADIGHITQDSYGFCAQMVRETGIAFAPGIDFDPEEGHRFIRISFALSENEVRSAMRLFSKWIKTYQPKSGIGGPLPEKARSGF